MRGAGLSFCHVSESEGGVCEVWCAAAGGLGRSSEATRSARGIWYYSVSEKRVEAAH